VNAYTAEAEEVDKQNKSTALSKKIIYPNRPDIMIHESRRYCR